MSRRVLKHLRSNTVAYLALFAALGGTSYAAAKINGKNLKNRSVAGKKLKRNSVTGKEVKESKLGKVKRSRTADTATDAADAAKFGGNDPSAYQGRSRWALVQGSDGSVLAQSGGITVQKSGTGSTGNYFIDFGAPVTSRPILATMRYPGKGVINVEPCGGAGSSPGAGTCLAGFNDGNHAFVDTSDLAGNSNDRDFYISVEAP